MRQASKGDMSSPSPARKAVFCEAVEITDLEQRRQFLDQACGADKALRAQVEGLLALSQGAGDFFKECAPALEAQPSDADQVLSAGEAALGAEAPETKAHRTLQITPETWGRRLRRGLYGRAGSSRFAAAWP